MTDDSDIKIYKDYKDTQKEENDLMMDRLNSYYNSGNKKKAILLAEKLAKFKPTDELLSKIDIDFTASILYQIRVLLTFTAEYTVRTTINDDFISADIVLMMYNYLKENEKGYYDNISDGGTISFYLLALLNDGDGIENIGKEFALRCSLKNKKVEDFGSYIFNYGVEKFTELINSVNFIL